MNESKRYQVLVYVAGRNDHEYAGSYDTIEEAERFVEKCRNNRDSLQKENSPLANHYKDLEWTIVDLAK